MREWNDKNDWIVYDYYIMLPTLKVLMMFSCMARLPPCHNLQDVKKAIV